MVKLVLLISFALAIFTTVGQVSAGERTISINTDSANQTWFITGERSLVMNGFDLSALGVGLPAAIDRVSIAVERPVPGQPVDVVIYQDANGGSPVDAVLAGRTSVDITAPGIFTATFNPPVTVTAPAVWIGFYLPVDFRFIGDSSGTSVLTYWAWTPNSTFDLANLSSAAVLGPADGSAPVNINMRGRARITAEITPAAGAVVAPSAVAAAQIQGGTADLAVMSAYPFCPGLSYDTADEQVTLRDAFNFVCTEVTSWLAPASPTGFIRQGPLYDVTIFQLNGFVVTSRLSAAVTHCIRPDPAILANAVIGLAAGAPRQWRILPTQRYGDVLCAEIRTGGNLSVFTPAGS
ncbi:MAG: hypothetical protein NZM00_03085 [Anaerolinea sp.]|nr:hypothetical protein [Anaerolinea sp.]